MSSKDAAPKSYIHPSAIVDEGVEIGDGTKVWHFVHLLSGTSIGNGCSLGQNVMVGPKVKVGNGCKVQNNVALYEGVELEDDVFCGPSCVFTNVLTPRAFVNRKAEFGKTIVRRGATIGANATIVCGAPNGATELGEYCFIAAGAVVVSDVKPHALMVGVPARQIKWVSREGEILGDDLICPRTGETYELVDGALTLKTDF